MIFIHFSVIDLVVASVLNGHGMIDALAH